MFGVKVKLGKCNRKSSPKKRKKILQSDFKEHFYGNSRWTLNHYSFWCIYIFHLFTKAIIFLHFFYNYVWKISLATHLNADDNSYKMFIIVLSHFQSSLYLRKLHSNLISEKTVETHVSRSRNKRYAFWQTGANFIEEIFFLFC